MFLLDMFDLLLFRILNGLRKRSPAHKPLQALRIRDVFNLCSFHSVRIGPFKKGGGVEGKGRVVLTFYTYQKVEITHHEKSDK